jgi:hypothetical protein
MIPLETYKVLHILGVLLAFATLGGLTLTVANGATKSTSSVRRLIAITHGVATFIILVGGFGALARLGVAHGNLPGWILVKLACWLVLAVLVAIPYRAPGLARVVFWFLPVLGGVAIVMAIYKPL